MGRTKGSRNKPKSKADPINAGTQRDLKFKEDKSPLEHEIVSQKAAAQNRRAKGREPKVFDLVKDYKEENNGAPKGSPTGKCKECGKEFEQDYSEDRNAYSSWRLCPECRKKRSNSKEQKLKEKEVTKATLPYTPFPAQQKIHEAFENHRFVVIDAGNRFGKDRCSIMIGIKYFIECLNENRFIDAPDLVPPVLWWIIAPTEKMAQQNWRELKRYFPKEWVVACSDSSFVMETVGGGIIEVRSGYDPESLVGVGIDLVLLTEAARFQDLDVAWANLEARLNSPGRGREKDRMGNRFGQGKAILNSSPIGRNYFYTMWTWGQPEHDDYDSDWWSCQCPWTDNPVNAELAKQVKKTKYGELTYEERLRRRIGDRLYRQNYLGEFLEDGLSVFRGFEEKCVVNLYSGEMNLDEAGRKKFKEEWEQVVPERQYCAGYDPATGSSGDNPWFVIRDLETNNVVRNFNLYGKNYEQQADFIVKYCKLYNYAPLYWLRTGHTAVQGWFDRRDIVHIPIDEQGGHKAALVQTLELAVENGDVHVLMDGSEEAQAMVFQMKDYMETKTKRGNSQYSNNQEAHDDCVSALYAAWSDYQAIDIPIAYCSLMGAI